METIGPQESPEERFEYREFCERLIGKFPFPLERSEFAEIFNSSKSCLIRWERDGVIPVLPREPRATQEVCKIDLPTLIKIFEGMLKLKRKAEGGIWVPLYRWPQEPLEKLKRGEDWVEFRVPADLNRPAKEVVITPSYIVLLKAKVVK